MVDEMGGRHMFEKMRLQKYISRCGIASRRHAEEMIREGRIRVNGKVVTEMGMTVSALDLVECDGKPIVPEENPVYIMLNKPGGYVTTVSDPEGRKTVMDLITVSGRVAVGGWIMTPKGCSFLQTMGILS